MLNPGDLPSWLKQRCVMLPEEGVQQVREWVDQKNNQIPVAVRDEARYEMDVGAHRVIILEKGRQCVSGVEQRSSCAHIQWIRFARHVHSPSSTPVSLPPETVLARVR